MEFIFEDAIKRIDELIEIAKEIDDKSKQIKKMEEE